MKPTVVKQQAADALIDHASAVFARHGYARTSIQAIADASGYSKAGLLHHFSSKQAIYEAAVAECRTQMQHILDRLAPLEDEVSKDSYAIELLVDLALARPGLVALLLTTSTALGADDATPEFDQITALLFDAFDAFDVCAGHSSIRRYIQVLGALAALSVLSLNAHELDQTTAWRSDIVRTSLAALGHPA